MDSVKFIITYLQNAVAEVMEGISTIILRYQEMLKEVVHVGNWSFNKMYN
jgi:hypothetical protein